MNTTLKTIERLFPLHCHQRVFLVGGCVRDHLLGRSSEDVDLAAALSTGELSDLGFRQVRGKSTLPIWFKHNPSCGKVELTVLQGDADLESDLARRDFTINAMAMDLSGNLIDPLGGRQDLEAGLLRPCSADSLRDDPLRIFRAFRFEADGWRLTDAGLALLRATEWSSAFENIPVERFSREMLKALSAQNPAQFFNRMLAFDMGSCYLPELFRMQQVPAGPLRHHPEGDLCTHSLQVLQRLSEQSESQMARFCALFHDIGKLVTDPVEYPAHHNHCMSGFSMAFPFCQKLKLSNRFATALAWTCRLHGSFNAWHELRDATRLAIARQAIKAGIVEILPLVSGADKTGKAGSGDWGQTVRVALMTTDDLGIDSAKLAGMPDIQRPDLILQKRISCLRRFRQASATEISES